MTELIKQRLVGMLIVVIAGVVFLPDLLDGQKQLTKEEFKKVPVKPQIDEQPILTEFPREEVVAAMQQIPDADATADDENNESEQVSAEQQIAAADKGITADHTSTEVHTAESQIEANAQSMPVASQSVNGSSQEGAQFKSQAWILQLGSFKHKENVDALRKKLKEAGYNTFTKPVKTKAGLLSKVYIGPELDKATLELAQQKLREIAGLEGKITRFDPIK